MNYYNEFDPYAAQWLRNLIDAGHLPNGEVDSRSIKDVKASELAGFVQCHFFAGLGGWSHALRLARWPEDRPVWTGSCPCQPFSAAGAGGGVTDERHLWPVWFNLIRECRPDVIFGEQVEAAINHGWLDLVQSDLEGEGYACGAVGIPAGGVGAPHIRQRLWFVADSGNEGLEGRGGAQCSEQRENRQAHALRALIGLEDSELPEKSRQRSVGGPSVRQQEAGRPTGAGVVDGLDSAGADAGVLPKQAAGRYRGGPGPTNNHWRDTDWLACRDGKWRPVEPGTFPLAHGVSARVGRLRAYGNAIVPQVAQVFIEAYLES